MVREMRAIRTQSNNAKLIAKKRNEIVKAATSLFVKRGYHQTSVADLSKALGMSKAGLYHYIGTKDDVLHLVVRHLAEVADKDVRNIRKAVASLSPVEALRLAIRASVQSIDNYRDMHRCIAQMMFLLEPDDYKTMSSAFRGAAALYEELLRRGSEAGDFEVSNKGLTVFDIVWLTVLWATGSDGLRARGYDAARYAAEQFEVIYNAVRADGN